MPIGFNFPVSIKPFLRVQNSLLTDLKRPNKYFVFDEALSIHTYLDDNISLVTVEIYFFRLNLKFSIFLKISSLLSLLFFSSSTIDRLSSSGFVILLVMPNVFRNS